MKAVVEKIGATVVVLPMVAAIIAVVVCYNAIWTMMTWNLIMPAFGIQKITMPLAIGFSCVVATIRPPAPKSERPAGEAISGLLLNGPVIALTAFVASHWITP